MINKKTINITEQLCQLIDKKEGNYMVYTLNPFDIKYCQSKYNFISPTFDNIIQGDLFHLITITKPGSIEVQTKPATAKDYINVDKPKQINYLKAYINVVLHNDYRKDEYRNIILTIQGRGTTERDTIINTILEEDNNTNETNL